MIKINFGASKYFQKITKDRAAKFIDMLNDIGGTIGLLLGFSIVTAVEIVYFVVKIAISIFNDTINRINEK